MAALLLTLLLTPLPAHPPTEPFFHRLTLPAEVGSQDGERRRREQGPPQGKKQRAQQGQGAPAKQQQEPRQSRQAAKAAAAKQPKPDPDAEPALASLLREAAQGEAAAAEGLEPELVATFLALLPELGAREQADTVGVMGGWVGGWWVWYGATRQPNGCSARPALPMCSQRQPQCCCVCYKLVARWPLMRRRERCGTCCSAGGLRQPPQ